MDPRGHTNPLDNDLEHSVVGLGRTPHLPQHRGREHRADAGKGVEMLAGAGKQLVFQEALEASRALVAGQQLLAQLADELRPQDQGRSKASASWAQDRPLRSWGRGKRWKKRSAQGRPSSPKNRS